MTKRFISRLCFSAVFTFLVQSCVHDEVNSNTLETIEAPSSAYASKSLWKEDEKYIKNVMKVFDEYADRNYFTSNFGTVYWDYALTFGTFNESYLEVPVIKNNKVSFIMVVYRENDRVFFKRKEDTASDEFFNALVFNDRSKYKIEANNGALNTAAKGCISTVTTWTWTNEDGSAGPTFQYTTISCTPVGPKLPCQSVDPDDANCGGSVGNNPGGGPGGGGGYPYPSQNENPCEKTKSIVNKPLIKEKLKSLKEHAYTNTKDEAGFQELKSGTLQQGFVTADNSIFFGIGPNSLGTVHTHQPHTIGIFAPRDIMTFLDIVRAQDANSVGNAYSGTVSSTGTYFINFTGTASNLPPKMTKAEEDAYVAELVTNYVDYNDLLLDKEGKNRKEHISNQGLEKLFNFLTNSMGLGGNITLIKEENGSTSTIQYNTDGTPKTPNPC